MIIPTLAEINLAICRKSLQRFTQHTKPDYQATWYHALLCRYLDNLSAGAIRNLMVFMPPRHGKSELVSRRLPAQFLGNNPDKEVIISSYSASLANRMNRDVQRIMDSRAYAEIFPDVQLAQRGSKSRVKRTNDFFELDGYAGSLRSVGVKGGVTGMGGSLIIVDDPFKNFDESHSQVIRDKVDEWYTSTLWTRQAPDVRMLLTLTRWHSDDLAGRLLERAAEDPDADQWTVLRFPAVADENPKHPLHPDDKRKPGEPLWADRFGDKFIKRARASLGSYLFTAMYQQTPTLQGGNHFKATWFARRYRVVGDYFWVANGRGDWDKYHRADCQIFATADPAASGKKTADQTAIGVWCLTPNNELLVLDIVADRFGLEAVPPKLREVCQHWGAAWLAVEADGFQVAIVQAARRLPDMCPIRALSHQGKGKLCRATPALVKAEAGGIILPESADWLKAYLDQLSRFTGEDGADDDKVDITAYAVWQVPGALEPFRYKPGGSEETRRTGPRRESDAGKNGLWGRR